MIAFSGWILGTQSSFLDEDLGGVSSLLFSYGQTASTSAVTFRGIELHRILVGSWISSLNLKVKDIPEPGTHVGAKTNARFKVEKGQMTTQLGQGKAIEIFNKNIVDFEIVH
jgi:hypothetical protein